MSNLTVKRSLPDYIHIPVSTLQELLAKFNVDEFHLIMCVSCFMNEHGYAELDYKHLTNQLNVDGDLLETTLESLNKKNAIDYEIGEKIAFLLKIDNIYK